MAEVVEVRVSELQGEKRLDAEFYQLGYVVADRVATQGEFVSLREVSSRIKKGIFDIKAEKYSESGVPFVRISDLQEGLVDDENMVFIPDSIHRKEAKTEFVRDDIVLSKTAYAAASIVDFKCCNISQDIIGVSLKLSWKQRILSAYLVAFLSSKYGLLAMQRWFQGNIQMHLALRDAGRITVPLMREETQRQVVGMYTEAQKLYEESKRLYRESEHLILKELGFERFNPVHRSNFVGSLSKAVSAHRVDAEYFQPLYEQLLEKIVAKDCLVIRDVSVFNRRGVQPNYVVGGEARVITSKRLGRMFVDYEGAERTDLENWKSNSDARIRKLDILIYTTGAYVGRTNCFLDDGKTLASNHVNILRIRTISPIFTALFLNSILGRMQVARLVSGSAQAELYPSDIDRLMVWNASTNLQSRVDASIRKASSARTSARDLLRKARRQIEEELEMKAAL